MFCMPKGAEIIAMAAAAQTDAASGTLRAPLRLTSSFVFRASPTWLTEGGERRFKEELTKSLSEDAAASRRLADGVLRNL